MRILIKCITGVSKEISFSSIPNIRELREKISEILNLRWDLIKISNISNQGKQRLCSIFVDDPEDIPLDEFIKANSNLIDINLDNLIAYVNVSYGPCQKVRPTQYNKWGMIPGDWISQGSIFGGSEKEKIFFKNLIHPSETNNFSQRLHDANFPTSEIPDKFLDPITCEIMNNPVITSDQRTHDESTIRNLNFKSPYTYTAIEIIVPNLRLRAELEEFVSSKELLNENKLAKN